MKNITLTNTMHTCGVRLVFYYFIKKKLIKNIFLIIICRILNISLQINLNSFDRRKRIEMEKEKKKVFD